MSHFTGNWDDFGMDTTSLTGALSAKLAAVKQAGFTQVMVSAGELAGHADGVDAAIALVRASRLRVTGLKALTDYEGLGGGARTFKINVAMALLDMCHALGTRRLLVNSSTFRHASTDTVVLARDLRKLALMAIPLNLQIVYAATRHGHCVQDYLQAWDLVCEADMPNLGLGLGPHTLDAFLDGASMEDLEMLDPDRVFLVQLADSLVEWGFRSDGSQSDFPVFPGEGCNSESLSTMVKKLHALGFRDDYSLAVVNTDYLQMPLDVVVQHAKRSALWLGETVLQRSVPLPNLIRLKRA